MGTQKSCSKEKVNTHIYVFFFSIKENFLLFFFGYYHPCHFMVVTENNFII